MSHFTTIKTEIRDIPALEAACADLKLQLHQGGLARGYAGKTRLGDYVIKCDGPYDIALNRTAGGAYELSTDWYLNHVAIQVGENYGRLLDLYQHHLVSAKARARGLTAHKVDSKAAAQRVSALTGQRVQYAGKLLTVLVGR